MRDEEEEEPPWGAGEFRGECVGGDGGMRAEEEVRLAGDRARCLGE